MAQNPHGETEHNKPAAGGENASPARSDRSRAGVAVACLIVAIFGCAIVLVRFAPRLSLWPGLEITGVLARPEYGRAKVVLDQVVDPWASVEFKGHTVARWRLLFPIAWHYAHLPRWLLLATPFMGCVLVLWLAAWLTYERLRDWWLTFLSVILCAALPWFLVSTGWLLYFDSWFVLGTLVATFAPARWMIACVCLLTPWIDERFVLALPICAAVRAVVQADNLQTNRQDFLGTLLIMALASVPYLLIRTIAWSTGDAQTTEYVDAHMLEAQSVPWSRYLAGLWSGFRAAWLLVIYGCIAGARRLKGLRGVLVAIAVMLCVFGTIFVAKDMSRTLMIAIPLLLWGIWQSCAAHPSLMHYLLLGITALNLVLPAAHVMWDQVVPIRPLPIEIQALQETPTVFTAARLLREADTLIKSGDVASGSAKLDEAIELDRGYAFAFVMRAALRMNAGQVADAAADLDEAMALKEELPMALYMRASIRVSQGQAALAVEDFRKALLYAPSDWPARAEAERGLQQALEQMK
jgi:hypothetical protein